MLEENLFDRRDFLATAIKTIAGIQFGMVGCSAQQSTTAKIQLPSKGQIPSLDGVTTWLNSQPLTMEKLSNKLVLINFWTYTCINWLRQLPYVRAWAEKYTDQGLVVIGVHTPEFEFEKNIDNVRRASMDLKVNYPIAVDSNYKIWRAFKNEYWPALYFIDRQGRIRHYHFGEGSYEQSERIIQQLLDENTAISKDQGIVSVNANGFEVAADWESLKSPENYLGYERTVNFASPDGLLLEPNHSYDTAEKLNLNQWSLSGTWTIKAESALLNKSNGRVAYCFEARDLHLVMGPKVRGTTIPFRVTLDGKPHLTAHGLDVDEQGNGTMSQQRLYQLIRQPKPIMTHRFEIEFFEAGAEIFAFTFG